MSPRFAWVLSYTLGPLPGQFAELARAHLPPDPEGASAVVSADVDRDGDLDLVLAHWLGLRLYLNDGAGRLHEPQVWRFSGQVTALSLAAADVDGDGDRDLAVGTWTAGGALFLNDGAGWFTDVTASRMPAIAQQTSALAFADFDRDGDLDLFLASGEWSEQQGNRVFVNDGTGRFRDESASRLPNLRGRTRALALADVDGDQDVDVLAGGYPARLYRNDGSGRFTDDGGVATTTEPWGVALGDVDGDGDPDALLGNRAQNLLFLNDGRGRFAGTAGRLPTPTVLTAGVVFADLDGDGDLDAALAAVDYTQTADHDNRTWWNDGRGFFTDASAQRLPPRHAQSAAVHAFDADGDGDADLVFANHQQRSRLYLNDGSGTFADGTAGALPTEEDFNRAAAAGDVDGDGDPDLVLGNYWHANRLLRNDGAGRFVTSHGALPGIYARTIAVALADVDGDRDLDLFVSPNSNLAINDGTGRFADTGNARLPLTSRQTKGFAVGDVDGDGDLDLVCANQAYVQGFPGNQDRLYLNDGGGFFTDVTATHFPVDDTTSERAALADLDGDGDLDLVLANSDASATYRNDGRGVFTDLSAIWLPGTIPAHALGVGDLDGDGDPDLACADPLRTRVLLNGGGGRFTDASDTRLPPNRHGTGTLAVGDVDDDGDQDLLLGDFLANKRLFMNDGRGFFTDAPGLPYDASRTWNLLLADLDEDGDLDAFIGNEKQTQPNEVQSLLWANLTRHLHSPWVPRTGGDLELELHAWPASPGSVRFGVVMVAGGRIRFPLPGLGVFRLDPRATALAWVLLPGKGGKATARFPIPRSASLIGATLHAQGLVFDSGGPRLTNPVSERVTN